ncbi:hypothetical protein N9408_02525 [Opitutales bacterium]|nr:hypothetical protein [Opitutales bacterium]
MNYLRACSTKEDLQADQALDLKTLIELVGENFGTGGAMAAWYLSD